MRKVVVLLLLACSIHCAVYLSSRICALEFPAVRRKIKQLQSEKITDMTGADMLQLLQHAHRLLHYIERCRWLWNKAVLRPIDRIFDMCLPYPTPAIAYADSLDTNPGCMQAKQSAQGQLESFGSRCEYWQPMSVSLLASCLCQIEGLESTVKQLFNSCTTKQKKMCS